MAIIKGHNTRVFLDSRVICASKACTLKVIAHMLECKTKESGGWAEYQPGKLSWQLTTQALLSDISAHGHSSADLRAMIGRSVQTHISFAEGDHNAEQGDIIVRGVGMITDVKFSASVRAMATAEITIQGNGRLSEAMLLADCQSVVFRSADGKIFTV